MTGRASHPNDTRAPHPRRAISEELARLLAAGEGWRTASLLGLASAPPTAAALELPRTVDGAEPRPISIWQPRHEAGELLFERPAPHPLGDHYSTRRVIGARKEAGRRRLVFLGESVAAGYLYAPHLTPAEVLEAQLCSVEPFEVIDLARTNETLAGLVSTAEAARQLEPDALVVFVGNNWNLLETPEVSPYSPHATARQAWAMALADGWHGPVEMAEERLARRVAQAFARLAEGRCPVILMLPEVHLEAWESRQPVPWLAGDSTPRWWTLHEEARAHLAAGRFGAAREAARAMRQLDAGVVGTADRLRARAELGLGRADRAAQAARDEVDHTSYPTLAFLDAPRAGKMARSLLERAAARHDFAMVDLRRHFATASGTALPGRSLFLDYCHLSFEGIRLAQAATASVVLERTAGKKVSWRALATIPSTVDPEVEALARFGAAIHGAHRLLAGDGKPAFLEAWCRDALAASPRIADAFRDLATARVAPLPAVLSAAQQRNHHSPHRLLLQHGWRWDFLDAELLLACDRALEGMGLEKTGCTATFADPRAAGEPGVELAAAPFLWEPLERLYPEVMDFADLDRRATLRSFLPRTHFIFVDGATGNVELDLTARLPRIDGFADRRRGEVRVLIDGVEIGRRRLGERFERWRFRLARSRRRRGIRKLTLVWPDLPPAGSEALAASRRQLEEGREALVHPVFGEVHSLRARWS